MDLEPSKSIPFHITFLAILILLKVSSSEDNSILLDKLLGRNSSDNA